MSEHGIDPATRTTLGEYEMTNTGCSVCGGPGYDGRCGPGSCHPPRLGHDIPTHLLARQLTATQPVERKDGSRASDGAS